MMRKRKSIKNEKPPGSPDGFPFSPLILSDQYALCITVKVWPAMVNVPVQEL
jgi:hypothetical protein